MQAKPTPARKAQWSGTDRPTNGKRHHGTTQEGPGREEHGAPARHARKKRKQKGGEAQPHITHASEEAERDNTMQQKCSACQTALAQGGKRGTPSKEQSRAVGPAAQPRGTVIVTGGRKRGNGAGRLSARRKGGV